jgi:hypothetical protein
METLSLLQENGFGLNSIKEIKNEFYKHHITVSYDANPAEVAVEGVKFKRRRFIFTCSKTLRTKTLNSLCLECNGLIIEATQPLTEEADSATKWEIIMTPALSPKSSVNSNKMNEYIRNSVYDIYYMEDGSIINLYWSVTHNRWVLSTARGIDMNNVVFSSLTYQAMFEECLAKAMDITEFWKLLDINSCYTFGIKHPDLHPFREGSDEPIYKFWFVQSVKIHGVGNHIVNNTSIWPSIKGQRKLRHQNVRNIRVLYNNNANAYNNYIDGKRPLYGYLLVSKSVDTTQDHSVVMLESSLMNTIRNLWYNATYSQFSKSRNYNRTTVILLSSYLNSAAYDIFKQLFPQFMPQLETIEKTEDKLVADIHAHISEKADEMKVDAAELSDYDKTVEVLANKVNETLTLDLHDKPLQKIRDIIHSREFFDLYHAVLLD